jgi:hypothetical protein
MAVTSDETCAAGDHGLFEPCPTCHTHGQSPTIITPQTADPGGTLKPLVDMNQGSNCPWTCCGPGSTDEQFLEAAKMAFEPAQSSYNAGFLRDDAFFALIIVNGDAEDDYSPDSKEHYKAFFQGLKADPTLFAFNYILSDPGALVAPYPDLTNLVKDTNGVLVNVQGQKWAPELAALWGTVLASATIFPLSGLADATSIQVYLGGPPPNQTPSGQVPGVPIQAVNHNGTWNWKYDSAANTVVINAQSLPLNTGDPLYIEYTLICG